jgi:hypothetical protein
MGSKRSNKSQQTPRRAVINLNDRLETDTGELKKAEAKRAYDAERYQRYCLTFMPIPNRPELSPLNRKKAEKQQRAHLKAQA